MRILRKRVLLGRDRIVLAHDAGDRLGLGHLALFDELLEGAATAATGGHLEEPGLVAPLVTLNADGQRLQPAAPGDVGGERVDRDARERKRGVSGNGGEVRGEIGWGRTSNKT